MTQTFNANDLQSLQQYIEQGFTQAWQGSQAPSPEIAQAIEQSMHLLNQGQIRVAQKSNAVWVVNDWVKKAILLYFRLKQMSPLQSGIFQYVDKIPLKQWTGHEGVRVVPPAVARYGSHIEAGAVLMPSYVNIGAYVGAGSMIDTWATVGSCAQIGKNVHLSGGVGIGGVLEPIQASPVIIEDHAFIGSRCIIVEGVIVEEAAVIGAGVTLTASTKIIDVTQAVAKELKGRVPARSVVIPGTYPKKYPAGEYQLPCALIIGQRKQSTDEKTSLNDVLREHNLAV